MYELYNRSIVHCDLKPGNILVSPKGHLAIADFGISMIADEVSDADQPFDECEFFSYGGTYAYQAPEMLISHHTVSFTCAADMWSFGVIIFEMYTNKVRPACYLLPPKLDAETPAVLATLLCRCP
jgi:serine/threonine protein kinase